jgi:DNA-binding beta-propeller fold protein YncE
MAASAAAFALSIFSAQAQDVQRIAGPVLGFSVDQTAGIRPILGLPGAATLGQPVISATGLEGVTLSPARDYALALLARGREVVLLKNLRSTAGAAVLDVVPGPSRIVISPSGDAAVLYYAETERVQVLAGLPDSPSVSWSLDLSGLSGNPAALAVSDGGRAVLIAPAGEPASVWLATADVGQRFLYTAAGSPSLAFLVGSLDAAIADGAAGAVVLVRDPAGQPQVTQIGGQAEGVSHPLAIAASQDNSKIFVANAQPAGVVSLSLTGEDPVTQPCACTLTGLERMAGGTAFRLNEAGGGPIWVLDAGGPTMRVVFVPEQMQLQRDTGRAPLPRRGGGDR